VNIEVLQIDLAGLEQTQRSQVSNQRKKKYDLLLHVIVQNFLAEMLESLPNGFMAMCIANICLLMIFSRSSVALTIFRSIHLAQEYVVYHYD
jgi:hypothetical protein